MIEVPISAEMRDVACHKAEDMGTLNNSISNGVGNVIGFIGEAITQQVLGGSFANTDEPNYHYDLLVDDLKVDVKTKRTSVKPLDTYECSVWAKNTRQKCDAYAFVRVKNSLTVGWFLGVMPKKLFYKKATLRMKGEKDPSNRFTIRADCYNIEIKELMQWTELVAQIKSQS
jgi:hypothetical protein